MRLILLLLFSISVLFPISSPAQNETVTEKEMKIFTSLMYVNYGIGRKPQSKASISISDTISFIETEKQKKLLKKFLDVFNAKNQTNSAYENNLEDLANIYNWGSIKSAGIEVSKFRFSEFLQVKTEDELTDTEKYLVPTAIYYYMPYGIIMRGNIDYGSVEMYVKNSSGWCFVSRFSVPELGDE